ncbi:MAG: DNA replication and repair protein RecF [Cytophagales bacterium]|nr:MAG: DNA replication and repair protein RecF [Cytophagales bacterium]TAF60236.1 MAG: DNA replication and repair protein RecF [Cytophagales bacterium]
MFLEILELRQFKNHEHIHLRFEKALSCFVGPNGIGKTNLLDAIHYCCVGKSAFNALDAQNIKHEQQFFRIQSRILKQNEHYDIVCALQQGKSKILKCNHYEYPKFSEHLGLFPLVLVCPDDTDLIREGSDYRRKFFDFTLAQINRKFLKDLLAYSALLKNRNAHLKQDYAQLDWSLIDTYDAQMLPLAKQIAKVRAAFCEEMRLVLMKMYSFLTNQSEQIALTYQTEVLDEDFEKRYKAQLQQDIFLKRTDMGVHKDDFRFEIGQLPIKKFGSQGQQKSFIIALKLAQFQLLKQHLHITPFLLLDDIFDKLDQLRTAKLLSLLSGSTFGQVFITDANPERVQMLLHSVGLSEQTQMFHFP